MTGDSFGVLNIIGTDRIV